MASNNFEKCIYMERNMDSKNADNVIRIVLLDRKMQPFGQSRFEQSKNIKVDTFFCIEI